MAKRVVKDTASQNLASAALSLRVVAQGQMRIAMATLHASAGITETVTLTIDQAEGSNYDVVLDSSGLNSEQDYIYKNAGSELILNDGDALTMACTNANTTGIVYGKIILVEN